MKVMKKTTLKWGLVEDSGSWRYYFGRDNGPFVHSQRVFGKELAIKYVKDLIEETKKQIGKGWKIKVIRKDL